MTLVIIVLIVLLLLGGGLGYHGYRSDNRHYAMGGFGGGSLIGLILVVLIVMFLLGRF